MNLQSGGLEGVVEENRHRHRADAARHRSDLRGDFAGSRKINVADKPVVSAIDADIDHDCPRFEVRSVKEIRLSDGGDDNVSRFGVGGEVLRAAMAERDRGVGKSRSELRISLGKHQSHRFSDDIAAADDTNMLATGFDLRLGQ